MGERRCSRHGLPCRLAMVISLAAMCQLLLVPAATPAAPVRVFIDEGYFMTGETEILRALIAASNGSMIISGESTGAFLSVKGYYNPADWDLYWTSISACHMAFPHMQPGQKVNCLPGVRSITQKKEFVDTWQKAYAGAAFAYIPRSYQLPEQYWAWRSHLLDVQSPPDTKWVLKANVHRGKGVQILPQPEAIRAALGSGSSSNTILVQQYLHPQMVVAGRSSYIRVWVLVTSYYPLRAYLFKGGFAVFGKAKGPAGTAGSTPTNSSRSSSDGAQADDDLVVNLWMQNRSTSVIWSIDQLCQHFDRHPEQVLAAPSSTPAHPSNSSSSSTGQLAVRRTFDQAWSDMKRITTLALAAAIPSMREEAAAEKAPDQGPFEYFGLDFVFDASLRPWLLEVNAVPSMARRNRGNCTGTTSTATCRLTVTGSAAGGSSGSTGAAADGFDAQKEYFVHDMLAVLGLPVPKAAVHQEAAAGSSSDTSGIPDPPATNSSSSPDDVAAWLQRLPSWQLLQVLAASAAPAEPPEAAAPAPAGGRNRSAGSGTRRRLFDWQPPTAAAAGAERVADRPIRQQQQQLLLPSDAAVDVSPAAAGAQRQLLAGVPMAGPGVADSGALHQGSSSSSGGSGGGGGVRNSSKSVRKRRRRRQRRVRRKHSRRHAAAAEPGAAPLTIAAQEKAQAVAAVAREQLQVPRVSLQLVPAAWRALFCPPGTPTTSSSSSSSRPPGAASSTGSRGSAGGFACVTCLTSSDLRALSEVERELSSLGRFTPVFDLLPAHVLNQQQQQQRAGPGSADTGPSQSSSSSSSSGRGLSGAKRARRALQAAPATPVGPASLDEYLSDEPGVWQRLHRAWSMFQQAGGGNPMAGGLAVMRNFTTSSQLPAAAPLGLGRQDYLVSAWLRLRMPQQQRQQRTAAAGSGGASSSSCSCLQQEVATLLQGGLLLQMLQKLTRQCLLK